MYPNVMLMYPTVQIVLCLIHFTLIRRRLQLRIQPHQVQFAQLPPHILHIKARSGRMCRHELFWLPSVFSV